MKKPKVKIEPSSHKGWEIGYEASEGPGSKDYFYARKGEDQAWGDSLRDLLGRIDDMEDSTFRIEPPLACLRWRGGAGWQKVLVDTVCKDRVSFEVEGGKRDQEFLLNMKNGHVLYLIDSPENREIINEVVRLEREAEALRKQVAEAKRKWRKLTKEAVMAAVKGGGQ